MLRDPTTTIDAEYLQAGSSYDIPKLTQQTYGKIRAADEIIDEGHFIGRALGEGMNGYRPIVELMNTNFGISGMAELSSAGNTYARRQQHDCLLRPDCVFVWTDRTRAKLGDDVDKRMRFLLQMLQLFYTLMIGKDAAIDGTPFQQYLGTVRT
jgi:hypothetical protein